MAWLPHRLILSLVFLLAAGMASCQQAVPESSPVPAFPSEDRQSPAGTRTPFQPKSPTLLPTQISTLLPTSTRTATLTATPPACLETSGRIEARQEVFSQSGPFFFQIYLPPCFDTDSNTRYPVLYMIHGQTFNEDQWPRLGIGEAADTLIAAKKAPPFLIVMPREENTFADIYLSRFRGDFIEGLIPWIDANYPTCAERACRAIGGLSRGGAWALHLGFSQWELFGAIGLHSTPPFNTDPGLFPTWLQRIPPNQQPRVYMDAGRGDPYLSMASAFEAQLMQAGLAHEWYLFNGGHDEAYWSAHVADYLAWYSQPWNEMFPEQ